MKKIIICFSLICFYFLNVQAQNLIQLSDGSGISLKEDQVASLESFANLTLPAFLDSNFKIIDASFYTFNDEMGSDREEAIWDQFKTQAKVSSTNYLLLGRQYFDDREGFKLWIHLEVDIEDLECYDQDFKNEISDYIDASQQELVEWYEYLSFTPETNDFKIVKQVAELGYYRLDKVCCEIQGNRNDCSNDRLNPKEIEDEKNLKYFILGRLRCTFNLHGCLSPIDVSQDNALNSLDESSFSESQNSLFWQSADNLELFGFMHIYISENPTNTVSCNVVPDKSQTRKWYIENDLINDIQVNVYDLGKFTIVIRNDKDLFEILESIDEELFIDLKNIVDSFDKQKKIDDDHLDLLKFASKCDFLDLEELGKYQLMKLIVSEASAGWYEFWRWYEQKYPIFIRQLYDSIGEEDETGYLNKRSFFEYQAQAENLEFANGLLSYDFPESIKKGFFKDYCIDYKKSYFTIGADSMTLSVNGVSLDSIVFIPYEVEKLLNFYLANLRFEYNKQSNEIDLTRRVEYSEYHGNSSGTKTKWIKYYSEKSFNPVCLTKVNIDNFSTLSGFLPAIVLPHIQNYIDDENFFNGIVFTVDVVSTASVVGNLGKIRHLSKVAKLKLFFTTVEVTATLATNLINYTNLIKDKELKKTVLIFLAVIEVVAAIGNGLSPSDLKHVQDKGIAIAKELDKNPKIDPKLAAGLRQLSGGRDYLLDRLKIIFGNSYESKNLYSFVDGLDEVYDANKISRLSSLSDAALIKVTENLTEIPKITKFTNDIIDLDKGSELVMFFNVKPNGVKAWDILFKEGNAISQALRTDPINLEKLSRYIEVEGVDIAKLKSSFANTKDAQKWIDLKLPKSDLDNIYAGFKNDPPFNHTPWTPEHKAQRWKNYEEGCANGQNSCLDFESWSNGYDGKIDLVTNANKGVDDYFNSLGWNCPSSTCRERTLSTTVDGQTVNRRLDIYDEVNLRGKEFKEYSSGKVYRSADIRSEVARDKQLLEDGQLLEMEWVFKGCELSGPLRTLLESSPNPITVVLIP